MIVTGGSLRESTDALKLAQEHGGSKETSLHEAEQTILTARGRLIRDHRLSSNAICRV